MLILFERKEYVALLGYQMGKKNTFYLDTVIFTEQNFLSVKEQKKVSWFYRSWLGKTLLAKLPEHDGGEEADDGDGADGGAAEVDEHLSPGLGLLPAPLPPHELVVPPLGFPFLAPPSLPWPGHGRGEQPQAALAADRRAVGVVGGEADLRYLAGLLRAADGGLELAPGEHHGVAHQRVAGVPVPLHRHGSPARHVHRPAGARVQQDPAQLQLRRPPPRRPRGGRRRRALALHGVDAERRGEEPGGRRGGLDDAGDDGRAPVVAVHGGDELPGQPLIVSVERRGGGGVVHAGEREGVGEEAARRDGAGGGKDAPLLRRRQRRPPRQAERAPRVWVVGERPEPGRGAARGGQGRPVQPPQRARQHVPWQVLHGGGGRRHSNSWLSSPDPVVSCNECDVASRAMASGKRMRDRDGESATRGRGRFIGRRAVAKPMSCLFVCSQSGLGRAVTGSGVRGARERTYTRGAATRIWLSRFAWGWGGESREEQAAVLSVCRRRPARRAGAGAVRGARRRARARACVSLVILPVSGTEPVVCHTGVEALRYAPCVRRLYIHHDVRNADLVAETQTKLILRYVARFFFPFSQCSVPKLEKKITPCVEYITWLSLCVMC